MAAEREAAWRTGRGKKDCFYVAFWGFRYCFFGLSVLLFWTSGIAFWGEKCIFGRKVYFNLHI
jgi:hypothetical protein